jgi:hypothetical protein
VDRQVADERVAELTEWTEWGASFEGAAFRNVAKRRQLHVVWLLGPIDRTERTVTPDWFRGPPTAGDLSSS